MKNLFLFMLISLSVITLYGQTDNYNNLFDYNKGVRVVDFSSNYEGSWDVQLLLENAPVDFEGSPAWCTAYGAPFPHHATVELVKTEWLDIIVFNNQLPDETGGWKGISAKDVEVYVSTKSAASGFNHVVSFRLENNKNHQVVKITPVRARWVKFVVTSNYGYHGQTELGQLGAYDDGIRVKSIKDEMSKIEIYFYAGSAEIREESKPIIAEIISYLKENPEVKIVVEGHTDNVGSESSNQKLSENRAKIVMNKLIEGGINKDRLSIKGYGSKQPISDNGTEAGRAQNRRVTIRKV
jgi:outer membrane protein OmpA-like peptidoglycan-associated protein